MKDRTETVTTPIEMLRGAVKEMNIRYMMNGNKPVNMVIAGNKKTIDYIFPDHETRDFILTNGTIRFRVVPSCPDGETNTW